MERVWPKITSQEPRDRSRHGALRHEKVSLLPAVDSPSGRGSAESQRPLTQIESPELHSLHGAAGVHGFMLAAAVTGSPRCPVPDSRLTHSTRAEAD